MKTLLETHHLKIASSKSGEIDYFIHSKTLHCRQRQLVVKSVDQNGISTITKYTEYPYCG